MNTNSMPVKQAPRAAKYFGAILIAFAIFGLASNGLAQQPQLSLADVLIGLRSKKVTLPERNKMLTDAVMQRGITFSLTTEIEKELEATGADKSLVDSIRKKSPIVKVAAVVSTPVDVKPQPAPAPPPPDFSFYQKRAESSFARGDFDAAVIDYSKVIELKPDLAEGYLGRGTAYQNKNWPDLAIVDFAKVIEMTPKGSAAYLGRAQSFEKKGDVQKAKADYQKVLELDAENVSAKAAMARFQPAETKVEQKSVEPPVVAPVAKAPESVDLGQLTSASATRMVTPVYSPVAIKSNISGKVTVRVTLDESGNVTSAKAIDGHQLLRQGSEDAAHRSKFKPAMFQGQPIKASGVIVYNYTPVRK